MMRPRHVTRRRTGHSHVNDKYIYIYRTIREQFDVQKEKHSSSRTEEATTAKTLASTEDNNGNPERKTNGTMGEPSPQPTTNNTSPTIANLFRAIDLHRLRVHYLFITQPTSMASSGKPAASQIN